MARRIEVEIVGDSRSLERAFDRSARSAQKFEAQVTGIGSTFKKAFAGVGAALLAQGGLGLVVKGLESSVNAASDLAEQMSKTQVVFGSSATEITAWSKTTATALGLSERQALATASSFGAMFAPLGIAGDEAANQSRKLTQLGADLASFYNTSVSDALDAIRSGIVGESEPLRRYGVLLSETRVQQEALAETGKKTAASLTDQEKVTARIALIMKDAAQASGDFARTSDGLANQQRILTAQIDDLQTALGEALLPAITDVTTQFNEWLANPKNKQKTIDGFTTSVNALGDAFRYLAGGLTLAAAGWDKYAVSQAKVEKSLGKLGFLAKSLKGQIGMFKDTWDRLMKDLNIGQNGGGDFAPGAQHGDSGGGGNFAMPKPAGTSGSGTAGSNPLDMSWLTNVTDYIHAGLEAGRKYAAAQKAAADYQTRQDTKLGWLEFGLERAQATKKMSDDRAWLKKIEAYWKERIQHEGRKLELVQELWRTQQKIRDLGKKSATTDKDPLAGLMQASTKQLTNILGAGTGLTAAGRGRLAYNIASAEPSVHHHHVYIGGREVANAINAEQTKTARRTAAQTSGRRG